MGAMSATIATRAEALSGWANTVRVLAWSLLLLGEAASLATVVIGFQESSTATVLSGLRGLFVTALLTTVLLMFASWALLAASSARR
jgi:hypothetical protein